MSQAVKVLFLGDLVGRPGRNVVEKFLNEKINVPVDGSDIKEVCRKDCYDLIIANVENASHGFGLTKKNHDELISYGINCMTSGNHIWDKKDIYSYIDESSVLIRPFNYHKTARGVGYGIINDNIIVINLLGKTFMQPVVCPFQALYDIMVKLKDEGLCNKIIIVDFHAEATAEKICFAYFAKSLGVSAVFGTHTHVQTADERLIYEDCRAGLVKAQMQSEESEKKAGEFECFSNPGLDEFNPKNVMAYITDVGFCGSYSGVIGMEYEGSLKRLVTSIPERFDVSNCDIRQINAVEAEFNVEDGCALNIKRINLCDKQDGGFEF